MVRIDRPGGKSMPRRMVATGALIRHNLLLTGREPGPLLSRLIAPVVIMCLLAPLYQGPMDTTGPIDATDAVDNTGRVVAGPLVMFSMVAVTLVGNAFLVERLWHTRDRLLVGAPDTASVLLGKAVPALIVLLLQQVVVVGFGIAVFDLRIPAPTLLVTALLTWAFTLLAVGAAVSTLVASYSALSASIDIGSLVSTALGGVLVPVALLPGWAGVVAPASPGYWALDAITAALRNDPAATFAACGVLLAIGAAAAGLAAWRLRR